METRPSLVVFTSSYPHDLAAEQSFLDPEIVHLAEAFDRVIVVPSARGGGRSTLPPKVEVDETLSELRPSAGGLGSVAATLRCPLFLREVMSGRLPLGSSVAARRLAAFVAQSRHVAGWLPGFLRARGLAERRVVLYTYWLDHVTGGLMLGRRPDQTRLVSRAHGYDLYEERQTPPYLPCRADLLRSLDRLYLISEHGRSYLRDRYPKAQARLEVSRLGTRDPGFLARPSTDGVLRVASCSSLVPVKRVAVLAEALARAARARPTKSIEWRHLGDGPLRDDLDAIVAVAPANLRVELTGRVLNQDVLRHYGERPVDLFANVSASEGVPVAIMEALSCGIPALAPAVGGMAEIVSAENGLLLEAPATVDNVASTIVGLLDAPAQLLSLRARCHASWAARFDAERNFRAFTEDLHAVFGEGSRAAA